MIQAHGGSNTRSAVAASGETPWLWVSVRVSAMTPRIVSFRASAMMPPRSQRPPRAAASPPCAIEATFPLLVEYFIERFATQAGRRFRHINKKSLDLLQSYDWPGNVRELQDGRSTSS